MGNRENNRENCLNFCFTYRKTLSNSIVLKLFASVSCHKNIKIELFCVLSFLFGRKK